MTGVDAFLQTVEGADTLMLAVGIGRTVIVVTDELSTEQVPLFTTALKYVSAVRSIGVVKTKSDDFCHFTIMPVLPVKLISADKVPEQIV
jgi:hypothetical protein